MKILYKMFLGLIVAEMICREDFQAFEKPWLANFAVLSRFHAYFRQILIQTSDFSEFSYL